MKGIIYLTGHKREAKKALIKLAIIAGLVGFVIGTIIGYWWSWKVNMSPMESQMRKQRALIEELKKGYVPEKPTKGVKGR